MAGPLQAMAELAHQIARRYFCQRSCHRETDLHLLLIGVSLSTTSHFQGCHMNACCLCIATSVKIQAVHKHAALSLTSTLHHLLTNKLQHRSQAHCIITPKASLIAKHCQAVRQCRKLCSWCGPGHWSLFCTGQSSTCLFSPRCYA